MDINRPTMLDKQLEESQVKPNLDSRSLKVLGRILACGFRCNGILMPTMAP